MVSEKKYLGIINSMLLCSTSKRKEIVKQLRSDIAAAREEGKTFEEIVQQMGSPYDLAREFNENMEPTDLKAAKREKRLKVIGIVFAVFAVLALIIYVVYPKSCDMEKSGRFVKEDIEQQGKEIIQMVDQSDFEGLWALSTNQLKKVLTEKKLMDARKQLSDHFGALESWGNPYMAEISQYGKHYAIMEITAFYENVSVTYRLTFTEDMKLGGIYMR